MTVLAADCGLATPADPTPRLTEIEAAIDRGLSWIEKNPATPQDGGLGDIIDEAVSFSVLAGLQNRPADRARCHRALRRFPRAQGSAPSRPGAGLVSSLPT